MASKQYQYPRGPMTDEKKLRMMHAHLQKLVPPGGQIVSFQMKEVVRMAQELFPKDDEHQINRLMYLMRSGGRRDENNHNEADRYFLDSIKVRR